MDIEDDGVTDPTAEFGELFEGHVAFESELGNHDADEMLGSIGADLGLGGSSHNRSSDDILDANLSFGPDDYLQNQHIVIDSETSEYLGIPMDVDPLDDQQQQQLHSQHHLGENAGIYLHQTNGPAAQANQIVVTTSGGTTVATVPFIPSSSIVSSNNYIGHQLNQMQGLDQSQIQNVGTEAIALPVIEGPKVKQKKIVVKDLEHFTRKNLENYLKHRGFKTKKGSEIDTKCISKGVFALSSNNSQNKYMKLVSFGSKYDSENIVPEIERLWKFYLWMKSRNPILCKELLPVLVPTLLHFYFEMILAGDFTVARRICVEFSKKFINEDRTQENYGVLVAANKISSAEALKSDPILSPIINRRCEIQFSELTLLYLRKFLSRSNFPILPNLFTDHFKVRQKETNELMKSFDWEKVLDSDSDGQSDSEESDSDDTAKDIRRIIERTRNSVNANLPEISIYTTSDEPICGTVSKKGSLVAFGLQDAGISLYSLEDRKEVLVNSSSQEDLSDHETYHGVKSFSGHAGSVYGLRFHPRTKLLFSVGQDSLMRVWDLNNSDNIRCKAVYRGHSGPIWRLDIPDSGRMIATAGMDNTARIFLPEKTEFVRIMVGHYFSVNTVKFHPNETYIATGSVDKSVRLWSVDDGNMVRMFTGLLGSVNALAFHGSGMYLAGGGEGKNILIWDIAEGEILAKLDSLKDCKDLQFCGNMLAACYRNGMVQLFNLRPIIGGDSSTNESQNPSRISPFTTKTSASSLFQLYYKNPGTLYCLGSGEKQLDEEPPDSLLETDIFSLAKSTKKPTSTPGSTSTNPSQSVNHSPLLQQVLQTNSIGTDLQQSITNTSGGRATNSSNSKILAARLSQPLPRSSSTSSVDDGNDVSNIILSASEKSPPVLPTPVVKPPAPSTSGSAPLISSSQLDAAIASVIDQSGASSASGEAGGTITMYASN